MSATILPFYSRRGDIPVPRRGEVLPFQMPLGGPHVTRYLNAALIAANALRCGHIADVECFSDFRRAVSDPS